MTKLTWREEFWISIKSFDTEEKLDLYFYRPFGFLIAKAAWALGFSPTMLTLIGLVFGVCSGWYFYHNENTSSLVIASVLFVMAGVFDSSDGQLARMGGKSTKVGLILDGICDNVVFSSAYIGCCLTMMPQYGWYIWPVGVLAGVCHSWQSSGLDYFNREYLFFGYGKTKGDYWNPTEADLKKADEENTTFGQKLAFRVHLSWMLQQRKISPRTDEMRLKWRALLETPHSETFQDHYKNRNRILLRFWRLMGPNFHTIGIITFAFLRRFDIYLIVFDLIFLTFCLFLLRATQAKRDQELNHIIKNRNLA